MTTNEQAAIIAALTPDQKEQLDRLLQARINTQYLPFGMSQSRAVNEIDESIKALVGFYYKGY